MLGIKYTDKYSTSKNFEDMKKYVDQGIPVGLICSEMHKRESSLTYAEVISYCKAYSTMKSIENSVK